MGEKTGISWCDSTFNPWIGCVRVSPGCEHCYAESLSKRMGRDVWGPAKTTNRLLTSENYWKQPLKWERKAAESGKSWRVFCGSMCDVFEDHPQVRDARERLFELIEDTPHLTWLLLTKRPENIDGMLPQTWMWPMGHLPNNIWLGMTAENQNALDARWPVMESFAHAWFPAKLFISAEPLLGPLDLSGCTEEEEIGGEDSSYVTRSVDWVIVGGESGPGARPMHPDWARSLRNQCKDAEISFFFKQWGEWAPVECEPETWHDFMDLHGKIGQCFRRADGTWKQDPRGESPVIIQRVGKAKAGDLLDGMQWHEFPEVHQ